LKKWTAAEDAIVREHYETAGGPAALQAMHAAGFERTIKSVNQRAAVLKLQGLKPQVKFWTPERLDVIRQRYAAEGSVRLAAELGTTPKAVQSIAFVQGIAGCRKAAAASRRSSPVEKRKPARRPSAELRPTRMRHMPGRKLSHPKMAGEPIITSETKVTICPHGVDRRFTFEPPPGWKGQITLDREQELLERAGA